MRRKEIVLIKETRQSEFVHKVMDSVSPHLSLKSSDKVAIKINLCGSREIYANTHYETVESLIFYLKEHFGITDISVIEGSDGGYYAGKSTWEIFYKFKYKEVELNGAKLVNLDELPHDQVLEVETLAGNRQVNYTSYETDYLISVVPPKTHNIFPVTLSILNMIGFVKPEDRWLMYGTTSSDQKKITSFKNEKFIQLLEHSGINFTRLLKAINPSMALIDGLYGMEGKGPVKGSPVFHGFAIASEDVVLTDALTTYIMGFEVDQVSYLSFAYYEGLGNTRWQKINGVDPVQVKFPYRPHPIFQKQKSWKDYFQEKYGKTIRTFKNDPPLEKTELENSWTPRPGEHPENKEYKDIPGNKENRETTEKREPRDFRGRREIRDNWNYRERFEPRTPVKNDKKNERGKRPGRYVRPERDYRDERPPKPGTETPVDQETRNEGSNQ